MEGRSPRNALGDCRLKGNLVPEGLEPSDQLALDAIAVTLVVVVQPEVLVDAIGVRE